jgi:hypothetical protein
MTFTPNKNKGAFCRVLFAVGFLQTNQNKNMELSRYNQVFFGKKAMMCAVDGLQVFAEVVIFLLSKVIFFLT